MAGRAGRSDAAMAALARERLGALIGYAYLLTGDLRDAEDLVQDAMVKTFLRSRTIEPAAAETYVRRTMLTLYLDGYRRRRRWGAVRHQAALAALPPRQRACAALRYYDDLTVVEIADRSAIPCGSPSPRPEATVRRRPVAAGTCEIECATVRGLSCALFPGGRLVPQAMPADAPGSFRPDVEGLRALAVSVVVLYHADVPGISGGFVGVDVFFVISGFLITSLLLREHARSGRVSLRRFFARRVRRLLPAAALTLVVTAAATSVLLGAGRAREVLEDGLWAALFAANLRFGVQGTDYLGSQAAPSPIQHFWSLAVEEQFYVVWPLLLIAAGRVFTGRLRAALAGVLIVLVPASLAWSVYQTANAATWAYFSPFTRAWELGVGALLAVGVPILARVPRPAAVVIGWLGLIAVGLACVSFSTATAFPGFAAALPVVGAAAVLAAGERAGTDGPVRLLSARPLQWLGTRSYSWYLWHWPALVLAAAVVGRDLSVAQGLAVSAASLALAAATYALVENPVRLSRPLAANAGASLTVGVVVTTVTALVMVSLATRAEQSIEAGRSELAQTRARVEAQPPLSGAQIVAQVRASAAATSLTGSALAALPASSGDTGDRAQCQAEREGAELPDADTCVFGAPGGARTMVLFGDSHAMMWLPGLETAAARRGWRLVVLTKSLCPVPEVTIYDSGRGAVYTDCDLWREAALQRITALRPELVVVASYSGIGEAVVDGRRTRMTPELWNPALGRTLERLSRSAGTVTMIGDIPLLEQSAPDCLGVNHRRPTRCATPTQLAAPPARLAVERAVVTGAGAEYVDVTAWLCTATTCPPVVGDTIAYYNASHVSASLARKVGEVLADEVGM